MKGHTGRWMDKGIIFQKSVAFKTSLYQLFKNHLTLERWGHFVEELDKDCKIFKQQLDTGTW